MQKAHSVVAITLRWLAVLALTVASGPGILPAAPAVAAPIDAPAVRNKLAGTPSNVLRLAVVSARTVTAAEVAQPAGTGPNGKFEIAAGAPINIPYKWIINADNTGDPFQPRFPDCSPYLESATNPGHPDFTQPNPTYPANCHWPSLQPQQSYAPIVAQGTSDELNLDSGLVGLPDGRYLISVLAQDGPNGEAYKLDGSHFLVAGGVIYMSDIQPTALDAWGGPTNPELIADRGVITVSMQPLPLPTATLRAKVFNDNAIVNGMFDSPVEDGNGLSGWQAHAGDVLGEVTTDVFGNPLCTTYYTDTPGLSADDRATIQAALDASIPAGEPQPGDPGYVAYTPGNTGRTLFDWNGEAIVQSLGAGCFSDNVGDVVVPNLGPNRYAFSMTPPANQVGRWIQTSTLEGNHDYDTWIMEGATGYDTEFVNQAEPFPWTIFGYVDRTTGKNAVLNGNTIWVPTTARVNGSNQLQTTGEVKGVVVKAEVYVPMANGLPYLGNLWGGLAGAKVEKPVANAWVSLTGLQDGDQAVIVTQADENGAFDIHGVPNGDYTLTYWDEPQTTLLDLVNVTVANGQVVDMGMLMVGGWFTGFSGHVFLDSNENGRMDAGEVGVDNLVLGVKRRSNSVIDRGAQFVTTTGGGHWFAENTYPIGFWLILELYNDAYRNTGFTFQAGNQPEETVISTGAVDIPILPIIGQNSRIDIGVVPYKPGENGGIAGTVSYGTTRNELNPKDLAIENWQVGIPNLNVRLWATIPCGTNPGTACDSNNLYELAPDGSYARGALLGEGMNEQWQRPTGCVARDVNGNPLPSVPDPNNPIPHQYVLPSDPNGDCLEGPLMGVQVGREQQTLDGNFGFGDLTPGDYIVEVEIPTQTYTFQSNAGTQTVTRPIYTPTREEDINVFSGDSYNPITPAQVPSECVGPLHIVDVAGIGTDGYAAPINTLPAGVSVPASTPIENPTFVGEGGSPFEGQARPLCNMKLVKVQNQKSVAPVFELFTEVPIPGRWYGYIVDDLNLSTDPGTLFYGEKAGVSHSPIGLYDYAGRLRFTAYSDPNGVYEPLMPSTDTISCPSPSGVCTGMYRHVGNDPGQPGVTGRINPYYDPQFRTISANFEMFPGDVVISDLAPTQVGVSIQAPGSQQHAAVQCTIADTTPQLFAINRPYVVFANLRFATPVAQRRLTITGKGFLAAPGAIGRVTLTPFTGVGNGPEVAGSTTLSVVSWSENSITVDAPTNLSEGIYHLQVQNSQGNVTTNGLMVHALWYSNNSNYRPDLYEVNPPGNPNTPPTSVPVQNWRRFNSPVPFDPGLTPPANPIQDALNAAAARNQNQQRTLVVVYPNPALTAFNPTQAYFTNLVMHSSVQLQGVGPGGVYTDATGPHNVVGSVLNGNGFGGDTTTADAWRTLVAGLQWDGDQTVYEGAVVTVLARDGQFNFANNNTATSPYRAAIDGFTIEGGDQLGFPTNINQIGGGNNGQQPVVEAQGGGIFVNGYARYLQITNNILRSNGGAYGGAVRLGTPNLGPQWNNHNENVVIARNQILANGGTNLAGALGIFQGTDGYQVSWNHICGNFSVEYGGAISHYGRSAGGAIHHNRIYFNRSMDEGGGIMVAGELPADPNVLSNGAGNLDIYDNIIQSNLSNDDGGGIRFLMAGNYTFNVYNNVIANNISTHEGGGVALNDAPNVRFYNNTVVKNLTTATAMTSNGQPAPAGLSTTLNSNLLQATLPNNAPSYSIPLMFNNIFWDNRAGSYNMNGGVSGIGLPGDAAPIYRWDVGTFGHLVQLPLSYSFLSANPDTRDYRDPLNTTNRIGIDPLFVSTYDTTIEVQPWRINPRFVGATIVAQDVPPTMMGNYHLQAGSPAINVGTPLMPGAPGIGQPYPNVPRPTPDIDGDARVLPVDVGADERGARNFFVLVLPDSQAYDVVYLPNLLR